MLTIVEAAGATQPDRPAVKVEESAPGTLVVTFPVQDNFSNGFIRSGMFLSMSNMARAAYGSPYPLERLSLIGTFPLVDQFGNSEEKMVARIILPKATYNQINWENFRRENLMAVGEEPFIHPALAE